MERLLVSECSQLLDTDHMEVILRESSSIEKAVKEANAAVS